MRQIILRKTYVRYTVQNSQPTKSRYKEESAKLTPWNRVLLEKLRVLQPVKNFPAFYEMRIFITAFTTSSHLFLSWARLILSMPPAPQIQLLEDKYRGKTPHK